MSIDELRSDAHLMTTWERHRFSMLIAGVIVIALFLVGVSMSLYNSSGTAQVDLSRPGYQDIRAKASRNTGVVSFPSTGELDKQSLDEFQKQYQSRAAKVTAVESYDAAAMSEGSLQLLDTQPANVPVPQA